MVLAEQTQPASFFYLFVFLNFKSDDFPTDGDSDDDDEGLEDLSDVNDDDDDDDASDGEDDSGQCLRCISRFQGSFP